MQNQKDIDKYGSSSMSQSVSRAQPCIKKARVRSSKLAVITPKNKISVSYIITTKMASESTPTTTTTISSNNQEKAPPNSQPPNSQIKVITFNILAPCWASPDYYPASAAPYLDRVYRRGKIINYLKSRSTTDVISLQEVTVTEYGYIKDALKKDYVSFQSLHSPTYWSNWITENPPWEPNGNAVFLKKSRFTNIVFQDIPLSDDGNHAVYVQATDVNTNKKVRIAGIHLDSDHPYNRERELKALFTLMTELQDVTDIVAGDFNIDINYSGLQQDIVKAHFINVLSSLGVNEVTSPYSSTYYAHAKFGVIDNITVRNGVAIDGVVISNGLFQLYPESKDEDPRVAKNMQLTGSDHFSVEGTVKAI
jgi:endonuclease/exonuclease/phosphatase family metal-dependent hydrolase